MKKLIKSLKLMAIAIALSSVFTASCPPADGSLGYIVLLPAEECSDFYSCSNGVPILMHCPDGLHFNAELDVCTWPQDAGCEDGCNYCGATVLINCSWTTSEVILDAQGRQVGINRKSSSCKNCASYCNFEKKGNCQDAVLCPTSN